MKIAALQTVSTSSVERNVATAQRLVAEAAGQGARLVVLPEYFCFMGPSDRDKLAIAEAPGDGPIQQALSDMARRHGVWVIGGTLPIRVPDAPDHALNASCVYGPDGRQAARYDKMHLFRFSAGEERYDETRTLEPGERPVAIDSPFGRLALSVCYDVRYPELYRALGAFDAMFVPSAFTVPTGAAHWETLLRARAIENQAYVIAPAQGGVHAGGRRTYGHSMIVDPWGEILAVQPEGEGVVLAEMDLARIREVQAALPANDNRRMH